MTIVPPISTHRTRVLEPFYVLESQQSGRWPRHGRDQNGAPVFVTLLRAMGTDRARHRVLPYLRPLKALGLTIEVLVRSDDLFVVWPTVGTLDLADLRRRDPCTEQLTRARSSAMAALARWHGVGVVHGCYKPTSVRFSEDLTEAWLVQPDLGSVAVERPMPSMRMDQRGFEHLFDPCKSVEPMTSQSQARSLPGREEEVGEVLRTLEEVPGLPIVLGAEGMGKSMVLGAVLRALRATPGICVLGRPAFDGDLRWMSRTMDALAQEVLTSPPLATSRIVAQTSANLGAHRALVVQLSVGWSELLGETRQKGPPLARVTRARTLVALMRCLAHRQAVTLLIDDADRIPADVSDLLRGLGDVREVRIALAATALDALDSLVPRAKVIELFPLSGHHYAEVVAAAGRMPSFQATSIAQSMQQHLPGRPHWILDALNEAQKLGLTACDANTWSEAQLNGWNRVLEETGGRQLSSRLAGLPHLHALRVLAINQAPLSIDDLAMVSGVPIGELLIANASWQQMEIFEDSVGDLALRPNVERSIRAQLEDAETREIHRRACKRGRDQGMSILSSGWHLALSCSSTQEALPDFPFLIQALWAHLSELGLTRCRPIVDLLLHGVSAGLVTDPEIDAEVRHVVAQWARHTEAHQLAENLVSVLPAASPVAQAQILRMRAQLQAVSGAYADATESCMAGLEVLETTLHPEVDGLSICLEVKAAWDRLFLLPQADAPSTVLQALLSTLLPICYVHDYASFPRVVAALVRATLRDGVSHHSVRGYTALAQLCCQEEATAALGLALGQRALEFTEGQTAHPYLPVVYSDMANFILPWAGRFDESMVVNARGIEAADALGDHAYRGFIRMHDAFNRFTFGEPLGALHERVSEYRAAAVNNPLAIDVLDGIASAIEGLQTDLPDDPIDPRPGCNALAKAPHHLAQALVALVHSDLVRVMYHLEHSQLLIRATEGWLHPRIAFLYLSAIAAHRLGDHALLDESTAALEDLHHRIDFVEGVALHARALRTYAYDRTKAFELLERAIRRAESIGLPVLGALAAEDAARLLAERGFEELCVSYQRRAAAAYYDWGVLWRAAEMGYGAVVSRAPSLRWLEETTSPHSGGVVGKALRDRLDFLRRTAKAERVEVVFFRSGQPRVHCESDVAQTALPARPGDPTIDPVWAAIHRCYNTRVAHHSPEAATVPIAMDEELLVVHLTGADLADDGQWHSAAQSVARWAATWDATQVDRAEHALLTHMISTLGEHLFFVSLDGRGLTPEGAEFELTPDILEASEEAMARQQTVQLYQLWAPQGHWQYQRLSCIPSPTLVDSHGDVEPLIWLATDATSEHLARRQDEASKELLLVRTIAGGIAHDLANIWATPVMLADQWTGAPYAPMLNSALASGQRMLRRMAALAQDPGHIDVMPLDLAAHVRESAGLFSTLMSPTQGFELEVPTDPIMVIADPGALDRILLNLVVNARAALPATGTVSIRVLEEHTATTIEVADNGQGFLSADAATLFKAGFSSHGSSGLGLHIVQQEAEAMGARISAESELGQGATFRIVFRRHPASERAPQLTE